jgi:hypothetical protein
MLLEIQNSPGHSADHARNVSMGAERDGSAPSAQRRGQTTLFNLLTGIYGLTGSMMFEAATGWPVPTQ